MTAAQDDTAAGRHCVYELTITAPSGEQATYAGMTSGPLARRLASHKSDARRRRGGRIIARWLIDRGLEADGCEWEITELSAHTDEHECRVAEAIHILTNRQRLINDRIEIRLR